MNKKSTLMVVFLAVFLVFGIVQQANAQLTVSPTLHLVNHYPIWYADNLGLQLGLCTDPVFCFFDPVDPANPDSVALGVGAETFYNDATAIVNINTAIPGGGPGGLALVRLAVEAAFGGAAGEPVDGDQIVFARARFRMDAPIAGTYRIDHPYGTETWNVVTPGPDAIRDDVRAAHTAGNLGLIGDIGCVLPEPPAPPALCDFALATQGLLTNFIRWDPAIAPAAPAGFLGNIAIEHEITGTAGPLLRNNIVVTGPAGSNLDGVGGTTLQTALWGVQGQIFRAGAPATSSATFTRNVAGDGTITVRVVGVIGASTADFSDPALAAGAPQTMTETPVGSGTWAGTLAITATPAVLPASVLVTINRGVPAPTLVTLPLTDVVTITTATFNFTGNVWIVTADSSNDFAPLPTLSASFPGDLPPATATALGNITGATPGTLNVTRATAAPPATVRVTSTSGGFATSPLTQLNPPAPPAPAGAGGGGGGGGGCFIESLSH